MLVVITLLVGAVLGIAGTLVYESSTLKVRAASRSIRSSKKQIQKIESQLKLVEFYHGDHAALGAYLAGRILLIFALWIGSGLLGWTLSVYNRGSHAYAVFFTEPTYVVAKSVDDMKALDQQHLLETRIWATVDVVQTAVAFVSIVAAVLIAYRGYRLWRRSVNFVEYKTRAERQIATLRGVPAIDADN